ncbi:MarR family winged helix-turn-helix transcriptional regulator [Streptomyces sp. NPDC001380]|uniref:MarR family winged helix-turn-helix transcriptional regulator n=1 Tax=Streptomyces sp. NPDC001380 TaxID=3364566 RepID=UPI0036B6D61E
MAGEHTPAPGEPRAAVPVSGSEVAWALRELLRANREAEHALARRLGMGATDLGALEHLIEGERLAEGGGLGPVELGDRLGIRSASATALVDRLQAAGHVTRAPHPTDRRRQVVHTTAHARQELAGALQPLIDAVDGVVAALGPDERDAVARFLSGAAAAVRAASAAEAGADPAAGAAPRGGPGAPG